MFGIPRLLTATADSSVLEHRRAMASNSPTDTSATERRPRTGMTVAGVPVAPSVQTVLGTLHAHEPMTSADIQATTGLPRRTVYAALRTLRGLGVLMERPSLRDMRQSYVWLAA